ncbi:MAG TPA: SRPBCC family protein [Pseudonocardiaceae bacterium]|nr:SRPBCC family protein [Pseudonocardiaceae bacterium]
MMASKSAVVSLPSDNEILITRDFDAPKHLVYRAYTEPALVKRWWAGDLGEVNSIEIDLRVGGAWRYVMTANGGFEVAFHGEFTEIVPNERLTRTEIFEAVPDAGAVSTLTLTEKDGRTRAEILVRHESRENRDMHLNSGMEDGLQEAMDYLEQVAVSLGGS